MGKITDKDENNLHLSYMDILPFVHVFKKCLNKIDKPNEIHNTMTSVSLHKIGFLSSVLTLSSISLQMPFWVGVWQSIN